MAQPPRVLLVDDEPVLLRLLQVNFRVGGFEVAVAPDGETALAQAERATPDAVVLDVLLPGIDGFEVLRRLREAPGTARVPVVMLSAQAQDVDRERGYALGVDAYVTKPFDPPALLALVREALGRASRA